jgi:hypothetical protein
MTWRGKLLAASGDAKTVKGEKKGYLTAIMYLAPHTVATKKTLCPFSSPACRAACLYSAGRGSFNTVQEARIRKAQWFEKDRQGFMVQLAADIDAFQRYAMRKGFVPCVRLNGTSDIIWERVGFTIGHSAYPNIMALFPQIQFYDYTKIPARLRLAWETVASNEPYLPLNYDLTFSQSEENGVACLDALSCGFRVATVFREKASFPETWLGAPVVDGDATDLRFLDPAPSVVALAAKGEAKKDQSGFVRL